MATLSEQQVKLPSSLRNILGLFLSSGMAQGAALVALPLLQRYCYGPSAFADMAVYSQLVGILGAVATFRFDLALVKRESADAARATVAIGLRVLTAVTLAAGLLALGLKYADSATGAIAGLWLLLPCGVFGMGVNGLVTGWLSRQERFGTLAWVRGGGSTLGEVARFLTAPMGASGLIIGRIMGQWCTAAGGVRSMVKEWRQAARSTKLSRAAAWKADRDYARYTTPANVLAMAANGAFIFFLFEYCPQDFVGAVGAGMAYLTVAAGLVIRSVNDVFFKHLDHLAAGGLLKPYLMWSASLILLSGAALSLLWWVPDSWISGLLGAEWAAMQPIMRILAPWMAPWIAASALSGVFPHLGLQSWTLVLDTLHLTLIVGLIGSVLSGLSSDVMSEAEALAFLSQYTALQAGFYIAAIAAAIAAIVRSKA